MPYSIISNEFPLLAFCCRSSTSAFAPQLGLSGRGKSKNTPRNGIVKFKKTWMPGTGPGMTCREEFKMMDGQHKPGHNDE